MFTCKPTDKQTNLQIFQITLGMYS